MKQDQEAHDKKIRDSILLEAKRKGRPAGELIDAYVRERFLYRISRSDLGKQIFLKGGQLLQVWCQVKDGIPARPTRDLDFLLLGSDPSMLMEKFRILLHPNDPSDGIRFATESMKLENIPGNASFRIRVTARVWKSRSVLIIDIGTQDSVFPDSVWETLTPVVPSLDLPPVKIRCYPKEAFVSEKYEAMVSLGESNSRMKDFYDIWLLSRMFNFEGRILQRSMKQTFESRGTRVLLPIDLTNESFNSQLSGYWDRYADKLKIRLDFSEVIDTLRVFVGPIAKSIQEESSFNLNWTSGKGKENGSWSTGGGNHE